MRIVDVEDKKEVKTIGEKKEMSERLPRRSHKTKTKNKAKQRYMDNREIIERKITSVKTVPNLKEIRNTRWGIILPGLLPADACWLGEVIHRVRSTEYPGHDNRIMFG